VGNQFALGVLYAELLAPEEALLQLKGALALVRELGSQAWLYLVVGALAGVYILLDDSTGAQTCLETVLSPQTPMDTASKRYCWARRAELALAQGDPVLALDITERLITSAPGMSPGQMITFLWKLKGEALSTLGQTEQAVSLLEAAIKNVQATGERFLLWRLHASLGRLYLARGRPSKAEEEFAITHKLVEKLADAAPEGELRDNFLQRAHDMVKLAPSSTIPTSSCR
jgi:tetratricopeptide (TPR) repeat protein